MDLGPCLYYLDRENDVQPAAMSMHVLFIKHFYKFVKIKLSY